jgi:predicted permease
MKKGPAMEIAFQKIFSMYFIMISAYFIKKKYRFSVEDINALVFNFFLPITIFYSIVSTPQFQPKEFLLMAGSGIMSIGLACLIAVAVSKMLKLGSDHKNTFLLGASYGNYGFLGLPIAFAFMGAEGALLALFYLMGSYLFLYSAGFYVMTGKMSISGFVKNPLIIATVLAMLCVTVGWRPSPLIFGCLALANQATFPLSMVVVGGGLQLTFYLESGNSISTLWASGIKLLLSPVMACLTGMVLGLSFEQLSILVILSAMPTGVLVTVFAVTYKGSAALSNSIVSLTTLISMGTIPLLFLILK